METSRYDTEGSGLELPIVMKPKVFGRGAGIRLIHSESDLLKQLERIEVPNEHLVQEYVSGIDASCSVLATAQWCFLFKAN